MRPWDIVSEDGRHLSVLIRLCQHPLNLNPGYEGHYSWWSSEKLWCSNNTGSYCCSWSCSRKLKLPFLPLGDWRTLYSRKLSSPFLIDENIKLPKILLFSGCIWNISSHVHGALELWKTALAYSFELQIYGEKNVVSFPILQKDAVK